MKDITQFPMGQEVDEEGVRRFADAMLRKLAQKRDEGKGGWNHPPYAVQRDRGECVERYGCSIEQLRKMLREHVKKGDQVDIANFCMMIWNRVFPRG